MPVSAMVSKFSEQIYQAITDFNKNVYEKKQQYSGMKTVVDSLSF